MTPIYSRIREHAREIAARFPEPAFYQEHSQSHSFSDKFFNSDPVITKLRHYLASHLEDNYGHGMEHATKVTLEAGVLMKIEGTAAGYDKKLLEARMRVVQCAGLLHDIKRKAKDHARLGAAHARDVLQDYPLSSDEIEDIYRAIHNHEAFTDNLSIDTPEGQLIADCVYDADKFRWGPDNFTYTLWDMISLYDPPLTKFMQRYPKGMEGIAKIKSTFRTDTGKQYGPQFIDIGLAIGDELYEMIKQEFAQYL
jgi:hypothetical protein